jgi:2',3'-cyclic-nucleotide 2'-phosphodiesterase/3'-nucleotidase
VQCFLKAQTINLKIIETSDVHGAIVPYDLINGASTNSSLAQVHSYVNVQRGQQDTEVILLDNGDMLQGDPMAYYYNYVDTSRHIFAEAMNHMKYDAATIGNHDIETGHPVYDKFRKQLNFPWLAANAINMETDEPYFEPYVVIERKGIRIAVLGLITASIPKWLPKTLWEGIRFDDMIEAAQKWIPIIQEKENPDLIVGLFHSGVDYNYNDENEDTYKNENASRLVAEQVAGFDIVFVGHDHSEWDFKVVNPDGDSVLILGPRSRAKTIAVANVSLSFDSLKNKWDINLVTGKIVETKEYKPDDMFMSRFLIPLNVVKNYVSLPLGQITESVSSKESLFVPSAFVDMIHTAQLEITDADVSFASPLSFDATIDSGWIKVRDVFKLYHYENFIYTMTLSGQEIKDYLEYSFGNWFNQMSGPNDHLLKFKHDDEGNIIISGRYNTPEFEERFYNYSSAAGLNYTVDVSKPVGEKVNITTLSDGRKFDLDDDYTVAINSYRGNGGGGHLTRGSGIDEEDLFDRVLSSTETDLRFQIMNWVKKKKIVAPGIFRNWSVIPEDWWKEGKKKDYKLIFGEDVIPEKSEVNKNN